MNSKINELTEKIIGAAIEVHRHLNFKVPILKQGIKRLVN